jgi:hypothetical protein
VLNLKKDPPRTIAEATSTGPRLGRYRFRVQELVVEGGKEYFVSYKEGWFGDRVWVLAYENRVVGRDNKPILFHTSYCSNGAALSSDEAMAALAWARKQVAETLKNLRASNERKHLKTIIEDI